MEADQVLVSDDQPLAEPRQDGEVGRRGDLMGPVGDIGPWLTRLPVARDQDVDPR